MGPPVWHACSIVSKSTKEEQWIGVKPEEVEAQVVKDVGVVDDVAELVADLGKVSIQKISVEKLKILENSKVNKIQSKQHLHISSNFEPP